MRLPFELRPITCIIGLHKWDTKFWTSWRFKVVKVTQECKICHKEREFPKNKKNI
jgi:hypothetical protein